MIRILVLVLLLISGTLFAAEKLPETLDEQLAVDNQRVMKYLGRLTASDVGKRLKGVRLSDYGVVLKNHVFLERIRSADHKSTVYVFREKSKLVAYAWVEPQGRSIPIPSCPPHSKEEGQYVLSGDVYTWKEVEPGDGVVVLECVTDKWIREIKRNK